MPCGGTTVEFNEEENTIYITGPQLQDFLNFACSTVMIVAVLQLVTMITNSQAIIVIVASVLTVTQTMWHLREQNNSTNTVDKTMNNLDEYPATSLLTNLCQKTNLSQKKDKNV
ncbi:putative transmembrane protein [Gregarina niphandrodes]|uniref:Transmembrane protein n=1 Tax=Gregarina niphandrodes TaxID=110365 RepID=A0A023B3I9_GRENI|nr:putative transmembrane protein [Gregarina niphandrodes]EZG55531.1 putative transmembrane protein [Gregarina niphandrodes]|eukprot:XP_011131517.1 putative transmembrane protein [Gregarina niphandrodes]